MTKRTVARRYAKGLLILAKKDRRVQELGEELSSLIVLMEQVPTFWRVLNDPVYDLDRRKQVLAEVARVTAMSPPVAGLMGLLLDKGRMKYLPFIVSLYQEMADEAMGRVRATVYAAVEPTEVERERIRERLTRITGKEIILDTVHDTSIIGGMVTTIKGLVLDGSLKTQLVRIKESLAKG
jgi:F-type H+-transporting ATPase subunit delta